MELTGTKVFGIFAGCFAIIIGVNITLAYQAVATFPGLETRNSYVASQSFDADRAAQTALGWEVSARLQGDELILRILDQAGAPVQPRMIEATLGRATNVSQDEVPDFSFDGQQFHATVAGGAGRWDLRLVALAQDGTQFRQRIILHDRSGT
ncbi:Nitrogen fixation protein FixH [Monaibacterium marinum]|uniref:Nitrogen fixation protein FixH n=1 Tax=Pontivivens marinum TaxID=1690039 RepID=A0A2C9CRJ7_9RHOB|nr:FixH family protein [Monaibacterium marinum]SOH93830.1 Nitrogen fixation protein FixH [Monaibacterium marinum]